MSEKNAPNNVIQFPGKRKEEAPAKSPTKSNSTPVPQNRPPEPQHKPVAQAAVAVNKMVLAGSFAAIILFTGAVNRYAFQPKQESLDLASNSSMSRAIASVDRVTWKRDATWEKRIAEDLASTQVREPASSNVGHSATAEERLRWGTLEEKYTILFKPDARRIDTISLQDANSNPTYILDRAQFLKDYGSLMEDNFSSAHLKSVEVSHDKTIEAYTLFDKNNQPKSEARFELDSHKRLLSLKVEQSSI